MGKNRKKYDGTKALVIKQLTKKFEYTTDYIRKCIRGDADSIYADEVRKEYNRLYKAIDNVLK